MTSFTWPLAQAGDALLLAATKASLEIKAPALSRPSPALLASPAAYLEALAHQLGLEASRHDIRAGEIGEVLSRAELALVLVEGELLLVQGGRVLTARGRHRLKKEELRSLALGTREEAARQHIEPLLGRLGLAGKARKAAADALLEEELFDLAVPVFELRLPATAPLAALARSAGLPSLAWRLLSLDALSLCLFLLSWRVLGGALLHGRDDGGLLLAWALLLATLIPLHRAARRLEASLAIGAGVLLKERLLAGTLRLGPEKLLHEGAGGLLGRVLEAETLQSALFGGGLSALVSAVELLGALAVLLLAGLPWAAGMLLLWLLLAALLLVAAWPKLAEWTAHRLGMTGNLVENMVGQRTRLAQLPRHLWHDEEDQELRHYHQLSLRRDRAEWWLLTLLPQGFLFAALLALAPSFLGDAVGTPALAAGLGACLLAQNALRQLATAFWQLAEARMAWRQAEPLLEAAAAEEVDRDASKLAALAPFTGEVLLSARELRFTYPGSELPVLRGANLEVRRGERILLLGPSGGGKSTLIALLAGLRRPQAGLLLAGGLDLPTLGTAGFRRRVALAPQFHQNHIITGPLAFNLLMGHPDAGSPEAQNEALQVCLELGLGPLLDRMPGGLGQMVGETGWQLSQGERSRVFMARALLQGAPVVVLDESLGALDPESFEKALDCLAKRAESLILVAHP